MSEDSILSYVIVGVVAYFVGRWVGRTSAIMTITRNLIQNKDDIRNALKLYEKELAQTQVEEGEAEAIDVERVGEQIFLYTKAAGEFIAQGASLEEAMERASKRFPDRVFKGHLTRDQAKELGVEVPKSQS